MTMQLAFGYRAPPRGPRGGGGPFQAVHVTEHDAIEMRPRIPQGVVIDWTDDDLLDRRMPPGAGDPAAGIAGPPSFTALGARRRNRSSTSRDGASLGALSLLVLALAVAVAVEFDRPSQAWVAKVDDGAIPQGRVAHVDARVVAVVPAPTPSVAVAEVRAR